MNGSSSSNSPTLLGHPPGLFTLFFAEMWERFSYYGMRALLLFYMIKGFLGFNDTKAFAVYGAYTSLVYATPFIGGMLADRLIGQRFAVTLGGILMAVGHLTMTVQNEFVFYIALALLIVGNGFFKPNISTMVGDLYPKSSGKKDTGFTLFYMGINLGAALSPILCGYVGETYGWHKGFGLATAGMLTGVAIFVAPTRLTQVLVFLGAILTACSMIFQAQLEPFIAQLMGVKTVPSADLSNLQIYSRIFLGVALLISGAIAVVALSRGGIPKEVGGPPSLERLRKKALPAIEGKNLQIYWGTILALGIAGVVYGIQIGSPLQAACLGLTALAAFVLPKLTTIPAVLVGSVGMAPLLAVILQKGILAAIILVSFGLVAFGSLLYSTIKSQKVERERMFVVLILTFFSMLFWAFFEQAGSSMNNFADRNIDRARESRLLTSEDIAKTMTFRVPIKTTDAALIDLPLLSQEQLGYEQGEGVFNMTNLSELREAVQNGTAGATTQVTWTLTENHIGMGILEAGQGEMPASEFQAANAIFILIFGLVFTAAWGFLRHRGWEPSTPVKFALGLLQVGLGFVVLWYGVKIADARGMVGMIWLILAYMLHTTGELCLSPVGLSMVTKLSPTRIVSTVMGAWFLATAFSNYLASLIAMLTRVSQGEDSQIVPAPIETVGIYGEVFGKIAVTAIVSALILFALTPILKRWMHIGVEDEQEATAS
ncbi:MAG: POT family proton-dependent oligopeptide transporter [Verrucomicrobiales bacterium]|jgi:POT family proton-dependent oligopeptide transporter